MAQVIVFFGFPQFFSGQHLENYYFLWKYKDKWRIVYYHVKSPCICKVQTNHTIITLKTVEIFFGWFVFNFVIKFLFPNLSKDQTKYFGCLDWPTYYLIRLHVVDLKEITFPLEVFGQGYGPNGWLFPCSMAVGTIRKIQLDYTNCQTLILAVSLPVTRLIGG